MFIPFFPIFGDGPRGCEGYKHDGCTESCITVLEGPGAAASPRYAFKAVDQTLTMKIGVDLP